MNSLQVPHTIDIRINGICNLKCPFCYGPINDYSIEKVSNTKWIELISSFHQSGARSLVLTGGEPLLRKGLINIVAFARAKSMRITLSTNGTLLQPLKPLLPYINDIGLPLDGSTHDINSQMRISNDLRIKHYEQVLKTIRYVHDHYPAVQLTIRTIVSTKNYHDITNIGKVIVRSGINPKKIRWKLYQVSPEGPRRKTILNDGWMLEDLVFERISRKVAEKNPEFTNVVFKSISHSIQRYLFLDPSGDAYVVGPDENSYPCELFVGNAAKDFGGFLKNLNMHEYYPTDISHGIENLHVSK